MKKSNLQVNKKSIEGFPRWIFYHCTAAYIAGAIRKSPTKLYHRSSLSLRGAKRRGNLLERIIEKHRRKRCPRHPEKLVPPNCPPNRTIVPHCHCEERSDVAISWNVLSKNTVGGDVLNTLKNSSHQTAPSFLTVIARSEATWQSPGTYYRKTP